VADFNLDGNQDFLWMEVITGELIIWYLNADMTYRNYSAPSTMPGWIFIRAIDMNNDSVPDIVLENEATNLPTVLLMNVNGSVSSVFNNYPAPGNPWRMIDVAKLNGDATPDFFWSYNEALFNYRDKSIWYLNSNLSYSSYSYHNFTGFEVIMQDMNNDGIADISLSDGQGLVKHIWQMHSTNGSYTDFGGHLPSPSGHWRIVRPSLYYSRKFYGTPFTNRFAPFLPNVHIGAWRPGQGGGSW
jgi:hypothetical protein